MVDEMQTLRTGLELARASQLTMVRLQLALHKSNRRTAMQALDNLLEIDAEMEGLAATLNEAPAYGADDAPLFSFIGFQKEAIAAEKHALTGRGLRSDEQPIAPPPSDAEQPHDTGLVEQSVLTNDEVESGDRTGSRRWIYVLAAAIVIAALGCGLIAYSWPELSIVSAPFWGFE